MQHKPTNIQEAGWKWLESTEWTALATLTFKTPDQEMSTYTAVRMFRKFCTGMKSEIYGRNSKKRIPMAPFMELTQDGIPHFHVLLKLETDMAASKTLVRRNWTKVSPWCGNPRISNPIGNKWFIDLSDKNLRGVLEYYVLKTCRTDINALLVEYLHLDPVKL